MTWVAIIVTAFLSIFAAFEAGRANDKTKPDGYAPALCSVFAMAATIFLVIYR